MKKTSLADLPRRRKVQASLNSTGSKQYSEMHYTKNEVYAKILYGSVFMFLMTA